MEAAFLLLMPFTCTLEPLVTHSGYVGEFTYGTPITPHCHIRFKSAQITALDGTTIHQEGLVYLDDAYALDTNYRLTIPVPGGTRVVKILGVDQTSDDKGYHHTILRFGAL